MTKNNKEENMDKIQLPQHVIDLERLSQEVQYGEVGPFYLKRSDGKTVGLRGQTSKDIRFRGSDEALIYIIDVVKSLPVDKSGEVILTLGFTNGVVKKINNVTDATTKYNGEA